MRIVALALCAAVLAAPAAPASAGNQGQGLNFWGLSDAVVQQVTQGVAAQLSRQRKTVVDAAALYKYATGFPLPPPPEAGPDQLRQWQKRADKYISGSDQLTLAVVHPLTDAYLQANQLIMSQLYGGGGAAPRPPVSKSSPHAAAGAAPPSGQDATQASGSASRRRSLRRRATGTDEAEPLDRTDQAPGSGAPPTTGSGGATGRPSPGQPGAASATGANAIQPNDPPGDSPPTAEPQNNSLPPVPPALLAAPPMAFVDGRAVQVRLAKDPSDTGAMLDSGEVSMAAGDPGAALDQFKRAVAAGDDSSRALRLLGQAAHEKGDDALAADAARRAYEKDPEDREALALAQLAGSHVGKASLPGAAKPGEGLSSADGGVSADSEGRRDPGAAGAAPSSGSPRAAALARDAAAALRLGDPETALARASEALRADPSDAGALFYRATAELRLGRAQDSLADAGRLIEASPRGAAGYLARAAALTRLKRFREAEEDARRAVRLEPKNAAAYYGLAVALAGRGDRAGVGQALAEAARLDPALEGKRREFVQLADDADLKLLFAETAPASPASPRSAPWPRARRWAILTLLVLGGGALVAAGLQALARRRATTTRRAAPSAAKGRYQLGRVLGSGGMGIVREAVDTSLGRRVALKWLHADLAKDPSLRRRFLDEARLVAALRHPNIVDIYDIVESGDEAYLVFEYVPGRTLAQRLAEGVLPFSEARGLLAGVCSAVAYAHERKIIHRDLKPSNIMLRDDGVVKVMDFGVARQAKDALTKLSMTNTVVGTPPYMAPEQEQGAVRKESDVFALGIVLYECLSGTLPFQGAGTAMLLSKIEGRHEPLSRRCAQPLPPGLDAVVAKALHPDPDLRYRSPRELLAALEGLTAPAAA